MSESETPMSHAAVTETPTGSSHSKHIATMTLCASLESAESNLFVRLRPPPAHARTYFCNLTQKGTHEL